jgi:DNA-binding transcriptional regulator YiaG
LTWLARGANLTDTHAGHVVEPPVGLAVGRVKYRPHDLTAPRRVGAPAGQAAKICALTSTLICDEDGLAALDRLLDDHTDAETAAALKAAGHRSGAGKPLTGRIVLELRRSHHLPSHADRLRTRGLLTLPEVADRLGVHVSTIKAWRRAGLLTARKGNEKNMPLFDPPDPADPRLVKQQGSKLARRVHTATTPGGAV